MSNDKFRANFAKRIEASKKKLGLFYTRFVMELDQRIILKTPVDNGQLHWNWFIGNQRIDYSTQEHDGTDKSGAIARNNANINSIKINGQMIYITNSLPYAYRVEYEGWSHTKAPAGMMRVSINEMKSVSAKIARELKASRSV
jgi:hypothetical protein